MTATEYVILVDAKDQEIGREEKMAAHAKNLLHRAFSIFVFRQNPQTEVLLQQRAFDKYHSGGLWTNTCCSHPRPGEAIIAAGKRRLQEEMGFTTELTDLGWFHYNVPFSNGLSENEIDHVLIGEVSNDFTFQPNKAEVNDFRWINLEDLKIWLEEKPEDFTPWFALALGKYDKRFKDRT